MLLDLRNIYKEENSNFAKNIPLALLLSIFFLLSLAYMMPSLNGPDLIKEMINNFRTFFGYKWNGPTTNIAYTELADHLLLNISPIQIIGIIIYNTDVILFLKVILLFLIGALASKLITNNN